MADANTIFVLSREDVIGCAREMGIPEQAITDDILAQVKKGVEWGLECWSDVVKVASIWLSRASVERSRKRRV
jgi:hypothetical protein